MKAFREQSYYELLDLPVGATHDQVVAACAQAEEMYGPDSLVLYSLVEPDQADAFRALIKEAAAVLVEPAQRGAYDRSIGLAPAPGPEPVSGAPSVPPPVAAPGVEVQVPAAPAESPPELVAPSLELPLEPANPVPEPVASPPPPVAAEPVVAPVEVPTHPESEPEERSREPRPRVPELTSSTEFNGELLRQLREGRGLSLRAVADRTRITRAHLENVEADRYAALPPTVYLRGILTSLARELKLDPQWVCRSYLALVTASQK